MASVVIAMSGSNIDLESLRRLVSLGDDLGFPDTAQVDTNLTYIGVSVSEAEVKWPDPTL